MRRILLLNFFLLVSLHGFFLNGEARGETRYFSLTFNGNYQTTYFTTYKNTEFTWGVELGIPLHRFFELGIGKSFTQDIYEYSEDYKNSLIDKGLVLPSGTLKQENDTSDTYLNLIVSPNWIYVNPSISSGLLMRSVCSRDYFDDTTCQNQKLTWNLGVGLSFYISENFRFKVSYKISPSGYRLNSKNYYDETYTAGITFLY
ncbi:hypothetical protein [Fluviispira vulneris]|uniref:hypothetical protein n=1 Tax=Fluviispira vulneris TaxID=2763012 RepID=UPI001648428D|nr:hypothetical protein [Fluviispira vulneris]